MIAGMRSGRNVDVALVGSYPPPHGGQSVHIRNLSRYLDVRGMAVQVFNTGSNKDLREDRVVNIASSKSLLMALLFGSHFKLLHVHVSTAEEYGKLVPISLAAMIKGFPWLVTIHSGNSADLLRAATPLRRIASRELLAGARKIICVNSAIRDELSNLVGSEAMAVISPFSVDFVESALPEELENFLVVHTPIISCVGLYQPLYGFDQAVLLMKEVRKLYPKAGLVLIGDPRGADWCRALIAEIGLEKHVKLCGNLGHQECLMVMSRSAIFLRPTFYDGDSLSVREALALGVRVVASATDFRPEGVTLYCVGAFEDFVAKVLLALGDCVISCRRSSNEHFNLEQVWQIYLQIMKN